TSLGLFFSNGTVRRMWRHGVEIVGTVAPSSFGTTTPITIKRNVIAFRQYNGSTQTGSGGPFPDTSDSILRDDYPQTGGSNGQSYDLDAPGLKSSDAAAQGPILRTRTNFLQWASITMNGKSY